jgi:hypothetical protein
VTRHASLGRAVRSSRRLDSLSPQGSAHSFESGQGVAELRSGFRRRGEGRVAHGALELLEFAVDAMTSAASRTCTIRSRNIVDGEEAAVDRVPCVRRVRERTSRATIGCCLAPRCRSPPRGTPAGAVHQPGEHPCAGAVSFFALVETIQRCLDAGAESDRDSSFLAVELWTVLHGVVDLHITYPDLPWPRPRKSRTRSVPRRDSASLIPTNTVPGVGFEPTRPFGPVLLRHLRLPFRHPGDLQDSQDGAREGSMLDRDRDLLDVHGLGRLLAGEVPGRGRLRILDRKRLDLAGDVETLDHVPEDRVRGIRV